MSFEYTVSRPYAKAAFEYAFNTAQLAKWSAMLEGMVVAIENEAIASKLKDPCVTDEQILSLIYSVGEQLFSDNFKNFIQTLSQNKRLSLVPYIQKHFEKLRSEAEKVVNVELISAFALTPEQEDRFREALKHRMKCDIALTCTSDASILAGAIIRAGDLLIDGSLRGKLTRLSDAMGVFH